MRSLHKRSNTVHIAVIALVAAVISACAEPPEEEMAAARQAVERAQANEDVRQFALESLEDAQQLLSDMESAVDNEAYDSARSLAIETRDAAEQAVEDAETAKTAARDRAQQAVDAARESLEEARATLEDARDVAGIDLDIASVGADLDDAEDVVAQAESELDAERYSEAETTAENGRATISDIVRRISDAVQAASGK